MKKLICLAAILAALAANAKAEERVLTTLGPVDVLVPGLNLTAAYLYDFVGGRNLAGAETAVLRYKALTAVVGLAGDLTADDASPIKQTPYLGLHTPVAFSAGPVNVGAFVGRDFNRGDNVAGLKASLKLW